MGESRRFVFQVEGQEGGEEGFDGEVGGPAVGDEDGGVDRPCAAGQMGQLHLFNCV